METSSLTMEENNAYEASRNMSTLHTWKISFYTLFVFVALFVSSLCLPFRYHSYGFTFANLVDANYYRHYMFFFCNGILLFLFLESGSKHTSKLDYSQDDHQAPAPQVLKPIERNEIPFGSGLEEEEEVTHDQTDQQDMEAEDNVIHVCSEHEHETNVKHDHEYLIEDDQETEVGLCVDDGEHEIVAEVVVEEDDQEEVHEFQQKCEAFIRKVKQSMHHEAAGPSS